MYDWLAGSHGLSSSRLLSKTDAINAFPMLQEEKLAAAIVYYDGTIPITSIAHFFASHRSNERCSNESCVGIDGHPTRRDRRKLCASRLFDKG